MAISDSESPEATTYALGRTEVPVGRGVVLWGAAFGAAFGAVWAATFGAVAFPGPVTLPCAPSAGAGPLRLSPAFFPQTGQACGP